MNSEIAELQKNMFLRIFRRLSELHKLDTQQATELRSLCDGQPCVFVPGEGVYALDDLRWLTHRQQLNPAPGIEACCFSSHYGACKTFCLADLGIQQTPRTLQDVLGLDMQVSLKELNSAYNRLSLRFIPDETDAPLSYARRKLREVKVAYETLSQALRETAVVRLQTYARARQQWLRTKWAVLKLQCSWRGTLATRQVRRVKQELCAVCMLQARARGQQTRQQWLRTKWAVLKLQCSWRGTLARLQARRVRRAWFELKASILIQSLWRRRRERCIVHTVVYELVSTIELYIRAGRHYSTERRMREQPVNSAYTREPYQRHVPSTYSAEVSRGRSAAVVRRAPLSISTFAHMWARHELAVPSPQSRGPAQFECTTRSTNLTVIPPLTDRLQPRLSLLLELPPRAAPRQALPLSATAQVDMMASDLGAGGLTNSTSRSGFEVGSGLALGMGSGGAHSSMRGDRGGRGVSIWTNLGYQGGMHSSGGAPPGNGGGDEVSVLGIPGPLSDEKQIIISQLRRELQDAKDAALARLVGAGVFGTEAEAVVANEFRTHAGSLSQAL